ncbi:MAG: hypothetical protein JSU86_15785 [Phycisphaerales bacterium]|nr:MAG: hypothetical protein JSU86_15785 [Phycisphaerales bacterium]
MTQNAQILQRMWMLLLLACSGLTLADDLEINRSTIDGGGAMFSTGGDFELSGTIGQPDAGVMQGGEFTLTGGFWFEEPPADCNSTGGVNLLDYEDFESCLSGPGAGVAEGCECFDVDASGTVDLLDFAVAQANFAGS